MRPPSSPITLTTDCLPAEAMVTPSAGSNRSVDRPRAGVGRE
jgi:hypothetical protein